MAKSVAGEPVPGDGYDDLILDRRVGEYDVPNELQPWHVRVQESIRNFTWNHHMGIAIAQNVLTAVTLVLMSLASLKYLLS